MTLKKVLIILYYWPPAGGPGVQRWLKFVKYLPEFGISPIIFCPENPSYPIVDNSLKEEIPEDSIVIKQPINEPHGIAGLFSKKSARTISSGVIPQKENQSLLDRLMLFIRGNFFIPDARKNWVNPSTNFLKDYLKKENIETIITTGPPHSLHLIGRNLKHELGVRWIADFRDPWTTIGYHKSLKLTAKSKSKHEALEHSVLNLADEIIVTSNKTMQEFKLKTSKPISVITNGYDTHAVSIQSKDKFFTLSHIGSLLSERNPEILWEVLSELIDENKDFSELFKLNLIGVVSETIFKSLKSCGLNNHLNIVGYVNHEDAIKYQMSSRVLLLIEINSEDTKAIIPGKLFEYLVSETPILALGPEDSDVEDIIKSTNTGCYFNYKQKKELKHHILELFNKFLNNELSVNPIGLKPYSRKELTKKLGNLILAEISN